MRALRFVGYSVLGAVLVAGFVGAVSVVGMVVRYVACDLTSLASVFTCGHGAYGWGMVPMILALICAAFGWWAVDILRELRRAQESR